MSIVEIIPYKKEHLLEMIYEPHNDSDRDFFLKNGMWVQLENTHSFTIFLKGTPVVCGGVIPYWEGRGQIWTMFSKKCGENFLPVFRLIKKFLKEQPTPRIEVCVPWNNAVGKRRAQLLGFQLECARAKKYLRGVDHTLYSLVKEGA